MKKSTKGNIVKGLAIAIDVTGPLTATLTQFPIWIERSSEATMSGVFLFLALVSCLPFIKQILNYFRSPAVWVIWLVLFVFLTMLSNIINEMIIVCFVGVLSNCIGTIIYKLGNTISNK